MNYPYLFTITGGRTGTAWLARLLGENLGIPAVHEPVGIDDFGFRMPDIKIMRTFNERGNTELIQRFYKGKLDEIAGQNAYVETNHTLAKCGLVENLANHAIAPQTCLIILRRDLFKQCISYQNRRDFMNTTIVWQWYLHYSYRNIIVDTQPFIHLGSMAQAIWYAYEMGARQLYYKRLYADKLAMIECDLEDINTADGASRLFQALGVPTIATLPPVANTNVAGEDPEMARRMRDALPTVDCNLERMVDAYLQSGRRLDR